MIINWISIFFSSEYIYRFNDDTVCIFSVKHHILNYE